MQAKRRWSYRLVDKSLHRIRGSGLANRRLASSRFHWSPGFIQTWEVNIQLTCSAPPA